MEEYENFLIERRKLLRARIQHVFSVRHPADIFFRGFPDQSRWCVPAIAASASFAWRGEGVHRVLLCEAIGRPLARACHRGIREFCLSRGARVFMRQARRRSCSPCCRPALREPGCSTLLQIARAVVGLDRTGMPSCPGAANETSPPRPSFPECSMPALTPWTNRSPVPPPRTGETAGARRTWTVTGGSVPDRESAMNVASRWMIANIALDDALILPHRANPTGLNFRERQPSITMSIGHAMHEKFAFGAMIRPA